jgi:mevalonate kinase
MQPWIDEIHEISETCVRVFGELLKAQQHSASESEAKESSATVQQHFDELRSLIERNHLRLNDIGVGDPLLDQVCTLSAEHGMCGKLTGAGGGGCAITLVRPQDRESVSALMSSLSAAGFTTIETTIGGAGVLLHNEVPAHLDVPSTFA